MDYYMIMGMVVVTLIALYGVYAGIRSNSMKEQEQYHQLEIALTKLTSALENFHDLLDTTTNRVGIHGKEIDGLRDRMTDAEHELANHETRIKSVEHELKEKRTYHEQQGI